uniref:Cytochrome b561 domain-containing protein n=1 Tax=Plectus sambesii TaxID=2011161 RepID=A0A914WKI3_9BILA
MMTDIETSASLHQYGFMKNLSPQQHKRNVFFATFFAAQVSGLLMVVLIIVWAINGNNASGTHVGGIGPFLSFYYHPVLMTIGMVFLTGQGAMLFRVLTHVDRNILKIPHLLLMSTVTILTALGTYAIFVAQADVTPMRDLHDWVGLLTIILFGVQFIFGFLAKFYPGASPPLAQWYRPVHNFMGALVFVLACASALTGLALDGEKDFSTNGSISKAAGLFTICFAICVVVLMVNRDFARTSWTTSKSEERSPLLANAVSTSSNRGYNAIE